MARQQNTMEIMQSYPIFTQLKAEEEALEARRWAFFRDVALGILTYWIR